MNVDDGPEDIRWIRVLGGEKLPAASYSLLLNLKKVYFLSSERDRDLLSPVFYTSAPKCVFIRRLAGTHRVSPAVTAVTAVQISWRSRWFVDRCLSKTRNLAASN